MIVKTEGICRGDGRIYIKLFISKDGIETMLSFTSRAQNGTMLPISYYPFRSESEPNRYVVVLPILSIAQMISVAEIDSSGKCVGQSEIKISPQRAKWESRLNYRFNTALTDAIRDFDEDSYLDAPSLLFRSVVTDVDHTIVHAAIMAPHPIDDEYLVHVIDNMGNLLEAPVVWFAAEIKPSETSEDFLLYEKPFSVKLDNSINEFCVFLSKEERGPIPAFAMMESSLLRIFRQGFQSATNDASIDSSYDSWFRRKRIRTNEIQLQSKLSRECTIDFSIIVPLYKTPIHLLNEMVESVLGQSYSHFELILVNASPDCQELSDQVEEWHKRDGRVRPIILDGNLGIAGNTNAGIQRASGDFICFLDHDDLLESDALYEYYKAIAKNPETDLLYCDEDKVSSDGSIFFNPYFKPCFNIDLLRSSNYICHFLAIRNSVVQNIEPSGDDVNGAQDHDLTFKATERARYVNHVSKILYHWRASEESTALSPEKKEYANTAGINAVRAHLDRMGLQGDVMSGARPFTYRIKYSTGSNQLVSIIIPNKDNLPVLKNCLRSIMEKTVYPNYEIVLIENNSTEAETFHYYEELSKSHSNVHVIFWKDKFNYSAINNFGAHHCKGHFLLFLNNDTEVINSDWLDNMVGICARDDVGVVGAKLYYPDDTIQHAGVAFYKDGPGHLLCGMSRDHSGYFNSALCNIDLSAVTGACMMSKKATFEKLGGFSEDLAVAFNDIDYCLKAREKELLVVETPFSELYHYESISRGKEDTPEKKIRFFKEITYLRNRWPSYFVFGDPYYNKSFNRSNVYYQLGD